MRHKQGASFSKILKIPSNFEDGYFVDWVVRAQVRKPDGTLIDELTCEFTDNTTRYLRIEKINTDSWPLSRVVFDIRMTRNLDNYTLISNTLAIDIVDNITEA